MVASAIRNQAVTSSIAAQAMASDPSGRPSIRRSASMRASTGNAVIDIDTPMNRANATNFLCGPTSVYSGSAAAIPSSIGAATLALEIAAAWALLPFSSLRSTSSPTRNMKKISPMLAARANAVRMSLGKIVASRLGEIAPTTDGPSTTPAITSPITRGCPTFTATIPNRRATIRTTAIARNTAATRCVTSGRCLVAVNCSPAGPKPVGVVSTGLAEVLDFAGVATSSGISFTFWSWRSFAVAVRRTMPPFVQATSPNTEPVFCEYVRGPSVCDLAIAR